jgi:hypothetical protein
MNQAEKRLETEELPTNIVSPMDKNRSYVPGDSIYESKEMAKKFEELGFKPILRGLDFETIRQVQAIIEKMQIVSQFTHTPHPDNKNMTDVRLWIADKNVQNNQSAEAV